MEQTYAPQKQTQTASRDKKNAELQGPSMAALRSGAAMPTPGQRGRQVDLPDAMRAKMENAFGADLSAVKLYESEAVADAGATAITQGSSIAFAPGMLDFTSFGGQALLGHEMSHVVSQARREVTGGGFLNDHALEARADREGAMAAAGQQIAMPTAALSPVTAAAAAGPMQAKNKDKSKGKNAPPAVPENLSFKNITTLKARDNDDNTAAVAKVGSAGGQSAVIKTGEDVATEEALSTFHNVAGRTFSEKHGGMWSFNAPAARGLTDQEKAAVRSRVGRNGTKSKPMMYSSRKQEDIDKSMAASGISDQVEDEINHMVAYSMAGGTSRFDPDPQYRDEGEKARFKKEGKKAILSNPTNKEENADYERMMGYIALTDLVTGNSDRLAGVPNMKNWMEERDTRQVHLIDNNFIQSDSAISRGAETRDGFMRTLSQRFGAGAANKGRQSVADTFINGLKENDSTNLLPGIFGKNASAGVADAISDLPEMRTQMQSAFEQQNNGKPLNGQQEEILERMQILHEYTTNPEMAAVYKQIADTYVPKYKDGKEVDQSETRESLQAQIKAMREAATGAQQQTSPAAASAASAPSPAPASARAPRAPVKVHPNIAGGAFRAKPKAAPADAIDQVAKSTEDFDAYADEAEIDRLSMSAEDFEAAYGKEGDDIDRLAKSTEDFDTYADEAEIDRLAMTTEEFDKKRR